jgi:hypothetical protein
MYGPRYWYETLPFLMILTARGAERAAEVLVELGRTPQRRWPRMTPRESAPYAAAYACVAALALYAVYAWLFGGNPSWRTDFVPEEASALRNFNGIDGRLADLTDDAHLRNALVVVEQCPSWQCYGSVFWKNSPSLDGDVVYARDNNLAALFAAFPDRLVYAASADPPSLRPYGAVVGDPNATPRPARELTPQASITPEPQSPEAEARDRQRRQDLNRIAEGLRSYRAAHGAYPVTSDVQTACVGGADAICAVRESLDFIPQDPLPQHAYLYTSTGQAFTLFAQMELAGHPSACPSPLPPRVRIFGQSLYCVSSG